MLSVNYFTVACGLPLAALRVVRCPPGLAAPRSGNRSPKPKSRPRPYTHPMTSDLDTWRSANQLINRYSDDAWFHVAQHADDMLEQGDMGGRRVWLRILDAVNELMKQEPDGAAVH